MNLFRSGLVCLLSLPGLVAAQSPPSPAYDISSVKPHDPGDPGMSWRVSDDGFSVVNVGFKGLVSGAWGVRADQVAGAPSWTDSLHWDIRANRPS